MRTDVLVIGGGPAGLSTAIAASLHGLRVTVIEARKPPIDKACGEGLLPEAVAALGQLGIQIGSSVAQRFSGIRFLDEHSSVCARIAAGNAFGVRRTLLHRLLVERALDLGVTFQWETRLLNLDSAGAHTSSGLMACKWLIGADGHGSNLRRMAGSEPRLPGHFRFGFRRHYEVAPWSDCVEVFWGGKWQMVVTPTGPREICVSLFTGDPHLRVDGAINCFPDVARRLAGARPLTSEAGAITLLSRARAVTRGNIALVGDASCAVDGIAGQGLSLAFQQALHLAAALAHGNLAQYESAHRRIIRSPVKMTRLLLAMSASSVLRRKVLRLFAARPALFARMINAHTGKFTSTAVSPAEIFHLAWRVIWA